MLVGGQRAAKFNEEDNFGEAALKHVDVIMVNLRLPSVGTDMLITWNVPHELMHSYEAKKNHSDGKSGGGSGSAVAGGRAKPSNKSDTRTSINASTGATSPITEAKTSESASATGGGGGSSAASGTPGLTEQLHTSTDPEYVPQSIHLQLEENDKDIEKESAASPATETGPVYCQEIVVPVATQHPTGASTNNATVQQKICPHTTKRMTAFLRLLPLIHVADWELFA